MLNKTFVFFIIFLCNFIFSNVSSDDQLNFDISQIEILDGGNKIIGKKRGKITSNNGITVNADQFEYNKDNRKAIYRSLKNGIFPKNNGKNSIRSEFLIMFPKALPADVRKIIG